MRRKGLAFAVSIFALPVAHVVAQQAQEQEQGASAEDRRASAATRDESAFTLPEELRGPCGRGIAEIEAQLRNRVVPTDVRDDVQSLLRRAGSTTAAHSQPLVTAARTRLAQHLHTAIDPGAAQAERFVPRVPETAEAAPSAAEP
jgi:hypothetical protein